MTRAMLVALLILDFAAVCVAQRIADAPWDRVGDWWSEAWAQTARAVVATGKPVIDANNAQNASFDAFVEALAGLDAALDREET